MLHQQSLKWLLILCTPLTDFFFFQVHLNFDQKKSVRVHGLGIGKVTIKCAIQNTTGKDSNVRYVTHMQILLESSL